MADDIVGAPVIGDLVLASSLSSAASSVVESAERPVFVHLRKLQDVMLLALVEAGWVNCRGEKPTNMRHGCFATKGPYAKELARGTPIGCRTGIGFVLQSSLHTTGMNKAVACFMEVVSKYAYVRLLNVGFDHRSTLIVWYEVIAMD